MSCAQIEGLDHFENVVAGPDAANEPDASAVNPSPAPSPLPPPAPSADAAVLATCTCDRHATCDADGGTPTCMCVAGYSGDGGTCVAKSCYQILTALPKAASGVYTVDPDGSGTIAPLSVYCDMTSDGGGWTLVHKNNLANTSDRTDSGYNAGALLTPDVDDVAVLPRDVMAALSPNAELRVLATNGYKIYSLGAYPYYTTDQHDGQPRNGMMKYDWAAAYAPAAPENEAAGNMHGPLICPAEGCTSPGPGLVALQRFCCGEPNAGFWFDGTQRFQTGYYAGSGWVR